jgi:phosphoribosyl 1,2-cyclic phosphate phosphodiesterase
VALLIRANNQNIAIDCGPDFRQQMLQHGVRSLEAIVLTHEHNDHIIGLDDVRPFNFMNWQDMPVYGTKQVLAELKQRFAYIFAEHPYPGAPRIKLQEISRDQPFQLCGLKFQPIEVMHGNLPVLGFRIQDFTYLTDVKTIAPEELQKIKGTKILVISALHHKAHHSHLNLSEALALIQEIAPEQAYLTHISHRMGRHEEVNKELPPNVALAYDGLEITVAIFSP